MTPQNASRLGRKLWRNRAMYKRRRKFGEEENRIEEVRTEMFGKRMYNSYLIDYDGRTVEENKRLVRYQLYFMKMQRGLVREGI